MADLNSRIFNLIIGRVFKKTYLTLNDEEKENMEKTFLSGDNDKKEEIIKDVPNFKILFREEAQKIGEEIKAEIEKQF